MTYISSADKIKECIFCRAQIEPEKYLVVTETEYSIAMLNAYPYNTGHVMIAPKRHVPDIVLLTDEELLDLSRLLRRVVKAVRRAYEPHGLNIGANIGRAAGAGIEDHVHIHIVPRWVGDTNFMPIISGTKTMPEDLKTTREKIKKYLEQERG